MTNELLDKYLDGSCTQEEKQQVAEWLQQQAGAGDDMMWQRWISASGTMPQAETSQLWDRLSLDLQLTPEVHRIERGKVITAWARRISVAAAILLIAGASAVWFHKANLAEPANTTITSAHPSGSKKDPWVTIANTGQNQKRIILGDSSVVVLKQGAFIRYRQGFEPEQRVIWLNGTAFFKAAPDKQRPFSVHAGDLITTAIGTSFTISEGSRQTPVTVMLHEGKVKVRQALTGSVNQTVYLSPGEQCRYFRDGQQLLVSRSHPQKNKLPSHDLKAAVEEDADTLQFVNTPLEKVLQQLQQRYHTTIRFNSNDIRDISFSGKITKADSLDVVLRIIAQMNTLELSSQDGLFLLSK